MQCISFDLGDLNNTYVEVDTGMKNSNNLVNIHSHELNHA